MSTSRCACIDIGSNTTRLLVADLDGTGDLVVVHEERAFTRIGSELVDSDRISSAKRDEVTAAVDAQLAIARDHGARRVRGVATAAIRRAGNGVQFVRELRARTGLEVSILSDREEARLAFVGAAGMLGTPSHGRLGVIDVGGGSTEVVIGEAPATILWWVSLTLGSGTLSARQLTCDPPSATQLEAARREVRIAVGRVEPPRPDELVAVGGSATSLVALAGRSLSGATLESALATLSGAPAATVAQRYRIDPTRARLLPAGVLILSEIVARLGRAATVGRGGIREGVLLEADPR